MQKERNESGQYVPTIDIERAFRAVREGGHVISTSEVADELDCSTEAARQKLTELHDSGRVERKEVASSAIVWWVDSPWPTEPPENQTPAQRSRQLKRAGSQVVPALVDHLRENGAADEDELKEVAWREGGDIYVEDEDELWDACKPKLAGRSQVDPGTIGTWRYVE